MSTTTGRFSCKASGWISTAGYTSTRFSSNVHLGYAYPAVDTDSDGFVDVMEFVIGTSPNSADSDADGQSDATEFPMIGVQPTTSDPCSGSALYCN